MPNYFTLLTKAGLVAVTNAQLTNNKVEITQVAVGDANGTPYQPTGTELVLRREVWRGGVSSVEIDSQNPNWIVVEGIIPATAGGFSIREVGLYDANGTLIAIGNYPDTYKPLLSDGSTMDLALRTIIEVNNASSVTLRVDPNVVVASRKYVDDNLAGITTQLEEATQKLDKKVYFFENVDAMKAAQYLTMGDLVETAGYYYKGDGGAATYYVTSDSADNYFTQSLMNGLTATLIINSDNIVNIKQIGGKPQDALGKYDNKQYVDAYIARLNASDDLSKRFKLYIPSGIWCFSPTTIYRFRGFALICDKNFPHRSITNEGTIITAFEDNQPFVWSIGNGTALMYNFEIGSFTISSSSFIKQGAAFVVDERYKVSRAALIFRTSAFATIEPILFYEIDGTAVELTTTWELNIDKFTFRGISDFTKAVMKLSPVITGVTTTPNISNVIIGALDFEVVAGDMVEFDVNSNFINSEIRTIIVEASASNADQVIELPSSISNWEHQSVIHIRGEFSGNKIGNILLNNFAYALYRKGESYYMYDTVVKTSNNRHPIQLNLGNIAIQGIKTDYNVLYNASAGPSSTSNVNIGAVSHEYRAQFDVTAKLNVVNYPPINVEVFPTKNKFMTAANSRSSSVLACKDLILRTIGPSTYYGTLRYDADAIQSENLVVRPTAYLGEVNLARCLSFLNDSSKKYMIRAKGASAATFTLRLIGKVSGVETTVNATVVGTGSYAMYELLSDNIFDDMSYVDISVVTSAAIDLDVIKVY